MKNLFFMILFLFAVETHASSLSDQVRPYIVKFLGEDIANKIFPQEEVGLALPAIPKINNDTKNLDVYKNLEKEVTNIDAKKMEQYNVTFINDVIEATREAKANRDEIAKWYNTLYQGATREGVYRAMVLDEYYRRLENYNDEPSKAVKEFTIKFMDRFIGKEVTEESLNTLNTYSIKRIITEDALDISDSYIFANKKDDFLTWYAVFSSELAKNYPIWTNKLRADTNPNRHLAWAQKMPTQFVKSEIILKLHILYNNLQKRNN